MALRHSHAALLTNMFAPSIPRPPYRSTPQYFWVVPPPETTLALVKRFDELLLTPEGRAMKAVDRVRGLVRLPRLCAHNVDAARSYAVVPTGVNYVSNA